MKPLDQLLPIPETEESPNRDSAPAVNSSLVRPGEGAAQAAVVVDDVATDVADAVPDPERVKGDQDPSANCEDDAADPEVPPISEMTAAVSTSKAGAADTKPDPRAQNTDCAADSWMEKQIAER